MRAAVFVYALTIALVTGSAAQARSGAGEATPLATEDVSSPMTLREEKATTEAQPTGVQVGMMSILSSNVNFDGDALFDMLIVQGELQWTDPSWRFVLHPRFKVRPLGSEKDNFSAFIQESYASYRNGTTAELKAGKIYEQFGRMWDFGVYGPLVGNTDLKLRPDIGFSLEGAPELQPNLTLAYALQYFVMDGQALELVHGYDIKRNVRHGNIVVGRIAPSLDIDDWGTIGVGLSGKRHTSYGDDLSGHQVLTVAADVSYTRGALDVFVETGYQHGASAALGNPSNNYSTTGTIDPYTYLWAGAAYDIAAFNVRFNWSASFYRDAARSTEILYQPGIGYFIGDNRELQIAVEGVFWSSTNPMARAESAPGWSERAVYLVAVGHI